MRLVGAEISVLSLLMMSLHGAAALTHSLKNFYTGSSGVPNFPEFVVVGLLDEVEIVHYDGDTKRAEPRQDWMSRVREDDPQFWKSQTELAMDTQQDFKGHIETAKQSFNQSGGVHIYKRMAGCEWDNETDEVKGYIQDGYDGEDFISFDLQTERWIAAKQQAVIIQQKWNNNTDKIAENKNFLTDLCGEGLKTFLNYSRTSLLRTEKPAGSTSTFIIIIIIAVAVLVVIIAAVVGFKVYRKRIAKRSSAASAVGSELSEELNPKP